MATIINGSTGASQIQDNTVSNAKVVDDAIGVAELSATGTASSSTFLRGDNAWAAPSGGGLTLLDTINTTSGTTVTSTTLSLTDYKFVYIDLYSISPATNTTGYLRFTPNGGTGTYFTPTTIASGVSQYGLITHNLDSGFFFGGKRAGGGGGINDTIRNGIHDSDSMGHNTGLSTATTSIAFDYTSGETFDNGVIRIYGLK